MTPSEHIAHLESRLSEMTERARRSEDLCRALVGALADAEGKLSSAHHIAAAYVVADRTAGETNWRALRDRVHESLAAARSALSAAREAGFDVEGRG